jgi:hypothetical protein
VGQGKGKGVRLMCARVMWDESAVTKIGRCVRTQLLVINDMVTTDAAHLDERAVAGKVRPHPVGESDVGAEGVLGEDAWQAAGGKAARRPILQPGRERCSVPARRRRGRPSRAPGPASRH